MKTKLKRTRAISLLLVLVITMTTLVMGSLTANAAEDETTSQIMLGDINEDGRVSVDDATMLQKYLVRLVDLTATQKKAADAYEDEGNLDVNDVTEILKHLVHIESNENIGKTWSNAETTTKTTLRYILINPNVCNTCDVPWIHEDGSKWTDAEVSAHMLSHSDKGESAHYRSQYDWYYVDENGHYHDLDDNGKVPHDHATEKEKNVFDPNFDPTYNWLSVRDYNATHTNKFSFADETWVYCINCNSDGTSIFDENGGTGNLKDGQLQVMEKKEFIAYPEDVADIDGYNEYYDECCKALEDHKEYHKMLGDVPEYLGEPETYIGNTFKIYNTETVTKEAGLY